MARQGFYIKVTPKDSHLPIWRRSLTPGNTTLLKLHDIPQIVMECWDAHLHPFTIDLCIRPICLTLG